MADEAEIEVPGHGTFVGFNLCGCGKFKHEYGGWYVGHFDAALKRAEGLGMVKRDGRTYSGRFVDGKEHGHWLTRHATGYMGYIEYHNGFRRRAGVEYVNGTRIFDGQPGDATDVIFLELKRGALDVEVCPRAALAPSIPDRCRHAASALPAGSSRGGRAQDRAQDRGAPPFAIRIAART